MSATILDYARRSGNHHYRCLAWSWPLVLMTPDFEIVCCAKSGSLITAGRKPRALSRAISGLVGQTGR